MYNLNRYIIFTYISSMAIFKNSNIDFSLLKAKLFKKLYYAFIESNLFNAQL